MMKLVLCLFSVFMMFPAMARADTCSIGQYWNSVDKRCDSCQQDFMGVFKEQCVECKEAFLMSDGHSLTADINKSIGKSRPLCTRVKEDTYVVGSDGNIIGCWNFLCEENKCTTHMTYDGSKYVSSYNSRTICTLGCEDGTYENVRGVCVACSANCQKCAVENGVYKCLVCRDSYTLTADKTSCVKQPACPSNCSECNSSGVCTKCNNGYKLKNGTCEAGSVIFCPDDMKLSADGCCCMPN